MKIKRLVGLLAELTPHAYSDSVVLMWLSQCENSILTDVFLLDPAETVEYEEITEQALLVPHPYDKLYLPYLQAQVAHANQEYDLYANLMALYNAYRYEYAQYVVNGADPGSGDAVARGYFLSAYGVAVAHGYAGTEEEWIASLKGATGAPGEPGMSAYEEAREQGFEGTETEWLASLKGKDGLSAYEEALEQGFEGTEAEWIASLEGKSAYEVALAEGFEGTASEWLDSIKGPAGRSTVLAYAPADGQRYTAQAEGVVAEQGCEIVMVPQSTNQGAATLALNGGSAYPLCLRPGWNVSGNELRPQLTLPLSEGMLLRGGEYIFRFDGAAWVLQSHIAAQDRGGVVDLTREYLEQTVWQDPWDFLRQQEAGSWTVDNTWCLYKITIFYVDGTQWRIEESWTDDSVYTAETYADDVLLYGINSEDGTIRIGSKVLPKQEVYLNELPEDAADGVLLIEEDEEPEDPGYVLQGEMKKYVDAAITAALAAIPIAEERSYG